MDKSTELNLYQPYTSYFRDSTFRRTKAENKRIKLLLDEFNRDSNAGGTDELTLQRVAVKSRYDQRRSAWQQCYTRYTQIQGGQITKATLNTVIDELIKHGVTKTSTKISVKELNASRKSNDYNQMLEQSFGEIVNILLKCHKTTDFLTENLAKPEIAGPMIETCLLAGLLKQLADIALSKLQTKKTCHTTKGTQICSSKSPSSNIKRLRAQENNGSSNAKFNLDDLLVKLGEAKSVKGPKYKPAVERKGRRRSRLASRNQASRENLLPIQINEATKSDEVLEGQEPHQQTVHEEGQTRDESQEMLDDFTEVRSKKSRRRMKQV